MTPGMLVGIGLGAPLLAVRWNPSPVQYLELLLKLLIPWGTVNYAEDYFPFQNKSPESTH